MQMQYQQPAMQQYQQAAGQQLNYQQQMPAQQVPNQQMQAQQIPAQQMNDQQMNNQQQQMQQIPNQQQHQGIYILKLFAIWPVTVFVALKVSRIVFPDCSSVCFYVVSHLESEKSFKTKSNL